MELDIGDKMYRKIKQWPSKSLKTPCAKVEDITSVQGLIKDLIDTCNIEMGVGLAANQIGVSKRVVVIKPKAFGHDNPDPSEVNSDYMVLINPVLHNTGDDIKWKEGCLSLKMAEGMVSRKTETMLSYIAESGEEKRLIAEWPFAGGLQHECDHLDGKLFIHHMKSRSRSLLLDKRRKKLKKLARAEKKNREI